MKATNSEKLIEQIERVREAQRQFSTFTQEQVDEIFRQAAIAANNARIQLAKMAVDETGMGLDSAHFTTARTLVRLAAEKPKPNSDRLREYRDSALESLELELFSTAPIFRVNTFFCPQMAPTSTSPTSAATGPG